jgi:hypothetical protein
MALGREREVPFFPCWLRQLPVINTIVFVIYRLVENRCRWTRIILCGMGMGRTWVFFARRATHLNGISRANTCTPRRILRPQLCIFSPCIFGIHMATFILLRVVFDLMTESCEIIAEDDFYGPRRNSTEREEVPASRLMGEGSPNTPTRPFRTLRPTHSPSLLLFLLWVDIGCSLFCLLVVVVSWPDFIFSQTQPAVKKACLVVCLDQEADQQTWKRHTQNVTRAFSRSSKASGKANTS